VSATKCKGLGQPLNSLYHWDAFTALESIPQICLGNSPSVLNLSESTSDCIKRYLTHEGWKSTGVRVSVTPELFGMDISTSEEFHISEELAELLCLQQDFTTDFCVHRKKLLVGPGMLFAHLAIMRLRAQWMLLLCASYCSIAKLSSRAPSTPL